MDTAELRNQISEFASQTHQLNSYLEVYNVNKYIRELHGTEGDSLGTANSRARTEIMKLKQQYMFYDFQIQDMRNLLMYTCFSVALVAIYRMNLVSSTYVWVLYGFTSTLFAAFTYLLVRFHNGRKWNAYSRMRWAADSPKSDE
jgi:hypothetical protein